MILSDEGELKKKKVVLTDSVKLITYLMTLVFDSKFKFLSGGIRLHDL